MKTMQEMELRELQKGNEIPQYICCWADGKVTQGHEYAPVCEAKARRSLDEPSTMLVGHLTPNGEFVSHWDTEGTYKVWTSLNFAATGSEVVVGLALAMEKLGPCWNGEGITAICTGLSAQKG